ncbi:terminase [Streptomyces sp. NPDC096030]|uniref:terminase n=1 Tax=Streptomyces sp. NPDC096030 TaxID=3155423 RepID=UPI00332040FE
MSSVLDGPSAAAPELFGHQRPRILSVPESYSSLGQQAIDLAAHAGLQLDPWQQFVLDQGLGLKEGEKRWSAFEVGLIVSRQNGKGAVFEARELAGLFIFKEQMIIHTAHEFKTAQEAFRRILALIENTDELRRRVARVRTSHGDEGVELLSGQRLRFLARSGGSGRGFSGDCVIMDEAMILGDSAMGALLPTMAARPNPQLWYAGSAGIGPLSTQLAHVRRRGLEGNDPSLAFFEWSIDPHVVECPMGCSEHDDPADPRAWAKANPGLGIRITQDYVARERPAMGAAVFARERLGVGEYPSDSADTWSVIGEDAWRALADGESSATDPVAFSIDMTPERSHASICVAGANGSAVHVEVVENRPGMDWVVERARDLHERWSPRCWVVDAGGPAGSLISDLERALDITVLSPKARQYAQACGSFFDAVASSDIVHLDQAPLSTALAGARKRDLGEAWAWARRGVGVDISPLVAVTLARWGLTAEVEEPEEEVEPWAAYG